jgi:hypothetical protein
VNSCECFELSADQWRQEFYFYNPKTQEGRFYAYKSGQRVLNIKFCDVNNICYTKQIYFSKKEGNLVYVDMKPFSNIMVWG